VINLNVDIKNQEYIPVTYSPDTKGDGIPIAWRVKKRSCSGILGNCQYNFGQVFLDEIWEYFWNNKDLSDEKKVIKITEQILITYFHEFLHTYYFQRMLPDDMDKEYYVNPNKTIQQVKGRLRTESWGWSEAIVRTQALQLAYYTILNDEFPIFLMNTLRDEIEEIRKDEPKTL